MFEIELIICIIMDLALNNLQKLICHKTQTNNQSVQWLQNAWNPVSQTLLCYTYIITKYRWFNANKNLVMALMLVIFPGIIHTHTHTRTHTHTHTHTYIYIYIYIYLLGLVKIFYWNNGILLQFFGLVGLS